MISISKSNLPYIAPFLIFLLSACASVDLDTTIAEGGVKIVPPELREVVEDRIIHMTEYDSSATVKFYKNGFLIGRNDQNETTKGAWKIDVKDRLCIKYKKWGYGDTICYSIYKVGDEYRQFSQAGLLVGRFAVAGKIDVDEQKQEASSKEKVVVAPVPVAPPTPASTPLEMADPTPVKPEKTELSIAEKAKNCPGCDLQKVNLSGVNLKQAVLPGANLTEANLKGANLKMANLKGVTLTTADLSNANLAGADLAGADLTGANLTGAELFGTNLKGATLDNVIGADLMGAIK